MRVAAGQLRGVPLGQRLRLAPIVVALSLVLGLLAGALPRLAAAQDGQPFETATVVPDDVLSYTVVPLDPAAEQWSIAQDLLRRLGLGQQIDELNLELFGESADAFPVDLFLGGEAAFVLTDTSLELFMQESIGASQGQSARFAGIDHTGLAVVMTTSSPDLIAASVQVAISDTAESESVEVQESEYEGVTISYVELPEGSEATPMATARVDDFILVAGFPTDLEPLIDTSLGNLDPLSDLDQFNQVRQVLDQDHLAFGYFNPFPSENLRQSLQQTGIPAQMIGAQAAGGFLVVADELGFRFETVTLDAAGPAASTFPDSQILTQTPGDVLAFFAGSDLAGTQILDTLGGFFLSTAGLAPPPDPSLSSAEEQLDAQYEGSERQFGVNLRTELFQQLTGEYGFWLGRDQESGALTALFAAAAEDPSAVSSALTQITLIIQGSLRGGDSVASRAVGETRVYSVETGDPTVPRVEFGVVDEQFVVGLGSAIDNVAQAPEAPLADSERFQSVMSALPAPEHGLMFIDLEQAIPLLSDAGNANVAEMAGDLESVAEAAADERPETEPVRSGDAADACAGYASQEEAQTAYDNFEAGSFALDQDFDGDACEDYFNPESPTEATPVAEPAEDPEPLGSAIDEAAVMTDAVTAFGLVAYDEDGYSRTTSLILVEDQGE